ncbi:unnamed protein product, partial [Brenthis ino]
MCLYSFNEYLNNPIYRIDSTWIRTRVWWAWAQQSWWGWVQRATRRRPGAWALYLLYGAVLVALYLAYLLRRATEVPTVAESAVERLLKFAGANPWVYAVVIVVSFVLVGLVAYMCCGPKTQDPEADPKKTDAVVEDDPHQSEEDGEGDEKNEEEEKPSKTDLEGPEKEKEKAPQVDTEGAGDAQRKRKARKE